MENQIIEDASWCDEEFLDIGFGDARLSRRFLAVAKSLASRPLDPISKACTNKHAVKAAYRFFANRKITPEEIMRIHAEQTVIRMQAEEKVFLIEDTSFIDFTSHLKTEGLGKISCFGKGKNKGKGLVMHTTLALGGDGLPLGILNQQIWARSLEQDLKRSSECHRYPIELKESFKWIIGMRESMAEIWQSSDDWPETIVVADREADIFEFMEDTLNQSAHFLIRAKHHDRIVAVPGSKLRDRSGAAVNTLMNEIKKVVTSYQFEVEVPKRVSHTNSVGTPTRTAKVEVKFSPVKFALPRRTSIRHRGEKLDHNESQRQSLARSFDVNVIVIKEMNPPSEKDSLEWILLTDLPVKDFEEAKEKINWYKLRWRVETFHKILKSGCGIEHCRLGTADKLKNYLSLTSVIAWRILWMSQLGRKDPMASCESVLTENEWKPLYCRIHNAKEPPETAPTVYEAIRWIAQLGGFLARKSDGEPGIITIWRGWQRLSDISEDWKLFRSN